MNANLIPAFSGVALALMAAGMAVSTPVMAGGKAMAMSGGKVALTHCSGVNQCKGHNDCKTSANACKGQGSCKGQGFVAASTEACSNIGGTPDPKVSFQAAASSQVQCFGVNACKGHNDCKTSSNACKGQGSCKGQGFVSLPASTCSNVGGHTS